MDDWRRGLREARTRAELTRAELARRSGVTARAIKAYEDGSRSPDRAHLILLLNALKIERDERAAMLRAVGFAPDDRPSGILAREMYSAGEASLAVERYRWPAFVVDQFLGVVAANASAQGLWKVDMTREFLDPLDRNLLSIATNPRFADRCVNWDEAVGLVIAAWKTSDVGPERLEQPSPYLAALLERFYNGDPKYVGRLAELWQKAPDQWEQKMRWSYPIVWDEPGIGVLRFECLASTASELEGLAFNDWIPVDSETWQPLEQTSAHYGGHERSSG